eukprot:XP_012825402.1 PREDICTED: major facilitator superfamily domain-containing protein 2B isoform X1 [Xenopus tropicalis]
MFLILPFSPHFAKSLFCPLAPSKPPFPIIPSSIPVLVFSLFFPLCSTPFIYSFFDDVPQPFLPSLWCPSLSALSSVSFSLWLPLYCTPPIHPLLSITIFSICSPSIFPPCLGRTPPPLHSVAMTVHLYHWYPNCGSAFLGVHQNFDLGDSAEGLFGWYLRQVYMIAAGIIGCLYLLCISVLFLGVKERDDPYALVAGKVIPFFKGFRETMQFGPYLNLISSFLLISAAVQIQQSNFVLFCTHAADLQDHFQNLVLTILIAAVLSIPFWQWFLQKFGKKMAAFGISLMIPFSIMLVTISSLVVAYVVAVASGLSIAASLLLPWSMLPDVVDNFRLTNPQGKGLEAIFYSSFVFFTKLSAGIALGISTLSLQFADYNTSLCKQSYSVVLTLKLLIGAAPALMIIIGLTILAFYPITEDTRKETELALDVIRMRTRRSTLIVI